MFLFTFMPQIVQTIFDYAAKLHLCQNFFEKTPVWYVLFLLA